MRVAGPCWVAQQLALASVLLSRSLAILSPEFVLSEMRKLYLTFPTNHFSTFGSRLRARFSK